MQKKAIIIGSGFGSLALAPLLAQQGWSVDVIEKNEGPGGRASVMERDGYRFDRGPSWYLMPEVFEKYFGLFDRSVSEFYALKKLSPQYRVSWSDGTVIDVSGDLEKDIATLEKLDPDFRKNFTQYLKESKTKYELAMNHVLYKDMSNLSSLINPELAKYGSVLGIFEPMHKYIQRFFSHPKIQQLLEYNLVFLGCSPQNAPSLFSLMAHVDFNLKVWYPEGGIGSVVQAFQKLGEEMGVRYHFNQDVTQIETRQRQVVAVKTAHQRWEADLVVSNADMQFTEDILDDQTLRTYSNRYWSSKQYSPSAFLLYIGLSKKKSCFRHHTLFFGEDWAEHFDDVFTHKRWPINPSLYINVTSRTDPTVAPKGHENLMVLVPVAPGLNDSPEWKRAYADYIIEYIEQSFKCEIRSDIDFLEIFSVNDFAERYHSAQGNALGGIAHTLFQSAIWRPGNKSKHLNNLYFVGAGTNPGIGVPTSVISGHVVAQKIAQEHPL